MQEVKNSIFSENIVARSLENFGEKLKVHLYFILNYF